MSRDLERTAELQGYIKRMLAEEDLLGYPFCPRQAVLTILQEFGRGWSELRTWRKPPTLWVIVAIDHCIGQVADGDSLTRFVDRDRSPSLPSSGGPPSDPGDDDEKDRPPRATI